MKRSTHTSKLLILSLAALLGACGGGGGGGGGSGSTGGSTGGTVGGGTDDDGTGDGGAGGGASGSTTFGTLQISDANAGALPLAISVSEAVLAFTQTAINALALYAADARADRSCDGGGTLTVTHQDLDSSFDISAGDVAVVALTDCYDPVIDGIGNGTVRLDISTFLLDRDTASIAGSLLTAAPFTITDRSDPTLAAEVTADVTFGFAIQSPETLTVEAVGAQNLTLTLGDVTETISEFIVSKTATEPLDPPALSDVNTEVTINAFFDSELLGGTFSCESEAIAFVRGSSFPDAANVLCRGRGSSAVRLVNADEVEVDEAGSGNFVLLGVLDWSATIEGFLATDSGLKLDEVASEIPLRTISVRSNDVIYDGARDRLLIATSSQDGNEPNALQAVSISNNSTTTLLSFSEEPAQVRLSGDGTLLYVSFTGLSEVRAYDASTLQPLAILEPDSDLGPTPNLEVVDFEVSPNDADSVAVVLRLDGFLNTDIVVFDNAVQLPSTRLDIVGSPDDFDRIEFTSDGDRLLAGKTRSTAYDVVGLDSNGVISSIRLFSVFGVGGDVERFGDRLLDNETVFDGSSLVRIGEFSGSQNRTGAIDDTNGFAYRVNRDLLEVFDSASYVPLASYRLVADNRTEYTDLQPAGDSVVLVADEALRFFAVDDVAVENDGTCEVLTLATAESEPYTRYDCPVTAAVYDPTRDKIFAAVGSALGVNGNSIAVIDHTLGVVEAYVYVGSEPRGLALSPDASLLHVIFRGADLVTTVDLNSLDISRSRQIGLALLPGVLEPRSALKVAVSPLESDTLVVSIGEPTSSPFERLTVFRNGVRLDDDVLKSDLAGSPSNDGPQVVFDADGDPSSLHGEFDGAIVQSLTIGTTGLSAGGFLEVQNIEVGQGASFVDGNEVFTPLGSVIDLASQTGDARFDTRAPSFDDGRGGVAVVANVSDNDVFVLVDGSSGAGVGRYDYTSGALAAEQQLDAFTESFFEESLIEVGASRLAVIASPESGLIVIDKSSIR